MPQLVHVDFVCLVRQKPHCQTAEAEVGGTIAIGITADALWAALTTSAMVMTSTRVEEASAVSTMAVTELAAMV